MKLTPFVLVVSAVGAQVAPAAADDAIAPETFAARPSFPHLGPDGVARELAGELGFSLGDPASSVLLRVHLRAQVVEPSSGLGAYGSLGFGAMSDLYGSDATGGLGGIELGGLYRVAASTELDATFRMGVVLPLGADDDLAYAVATVWQDPSNFATAFDAPTIRFAASPTWHRDRLYLRADLGVDLTRGDGDEVSMVHADLGVALAPSPVGGAVEVQTLCTMEQVRDCVHLLAATAQFQSKPGDALHAGVALPLIDTDLGDVYTIEVGYTARY